MHVMGYANKRSMRGQNLLILISFFYNKIIFFKPTLVYYQWIIRCSSDVGYYSQFYIFTVICCDVDFTVTAKMSKHTHISHRNRLYILTIQNVLYYYYRGHCGRVE